MKRISLAVLLLFACLGYSQGQTPTPAPIPFPVLQNLGANDNPLLTTSVPVTYRYGTSSCNNGASAWLPWVTATLTNFETLWSTFPSDPCPGASKELDVVEQATSFTIGVNTNGVMSTVVVPAAANLGPPPPKMEWRSICQDCLVTLNTGTGGPLILKLGQTGTPFPYSAPVSSTGAIYGQVDIGITYTVNWTNDGTTQYTTSISAAGVFTTVNKACISVVILSYQTTICGPTGINTFQPATTPPASTP